MMEGTAMTIRDEATRRALEMEFEKAVAPREVGVEWSYGDLRYRIEGLETGRISSADVNWQRVMEDLQRIRGDLLRNGARLNPWEPPTAPPTSA
jgi:hypothetical protein